VLHLLGDRDLNGAQSTAVSTPQYMRLLEGESS